MQICSGANHEEKQGEDRAAWSPATKTLDSREIPKRCRGYKSSINLQLPTAYHLQTNRASVRNIRTLEQIYHADVAYNRDDGTRFKDKATSENQHKTGTSRSRAGGM